MPLARRMSNSSVASASSRQSFPATIKSSTKVNKEKVGKIMTRRKSRHQSVAEDKENDTANNILQSPTPYWKVAKERGNNTPPETRSAKKRKTTPGAKKLDFTAGYDDNAENGSGLLVFSPPDQKANARHEKNERERKERERASRVENARDSGQLLVFSPTFRNPAPLPASPDGEHRRNLHEVESLENEIDTGSEHDSEDPKVDMGNDNDTSSPTDMEVEVAEHGSGKSQVSLVTATSNAHNEAITLELKNLRETINKLVDRKSNTDDSKQQHRSLEAHMIRTEKVLLENSKLEQKVEMLEETLKGQKSKSSKEKDALVVEAARLQTELSNASEEANKHVKALEHVKMQMEAQVTESQIEKGRLMEQIKQLQNALEEARSRLDESKHFMESLEDELAEEKRTLAEEQVELRNSMTGLEKELDDVKKINFTLEETLIKYEEKIDRLENSLLPESEDQLRNALKKLDDSEKNDAELREELAKLEQHVISLKQELSQARSEQEEERKTFQELNEESSIAYEQTRKSLEEKDARIEDLNASIKNLKRSFTTESEKLNDASSELEAVRTEMGARTNELEEMLKQVTAKLESTINEKQAVEEKLRIAMEQMEENASFKAKVLARSNETSAANEALQQQIAKLEEALRTSKSECEAAQKRVETFNEREAELFSKLQESDRVRRGLHNRVMQLSGNIRVFVRVRPELPTEKEAVKASAGMSEPSDTKKRKHSQIDDQGPFRYPGMAGRESNKSTFGADDPTKNLLEVTEPWRDRGGLSERRKKWVFGFDNIFTPAHGQEDIWEATEPLVQSAVDGYNVCLFAYGQTSSGKTYTMLGEPGNEGLVSRSVRKLFAAREAIAELTRAESKVEVSVELLEVYNEKVRDLLAAGNVEGQEGSLKVKANAAVGSTVVLVNNEGEVASILAKAQSRRCVKATASNAVSSRSHMLFTIHFKVLSRDGSSRVGKLNICDLAGSERLSKSNANEHVGGALLKETKHINSSLSVLSNVIEKLQAGDSNIPYRESKLTHLLQNSLGGNSKTLAIVCCNPLQSHFHETLCSLRFAAKVNKVDLKAVANFSA